MVTAILLTTIVLFSADECDTYLQIMDNNKPVGATSYKASGNVIVQLLGGHAVLTCNGKVYSAYVLEDVIVED